MPSLAERLSAARHERFVGRDGEIFVFQSALAAREFLFFVLHIFGPGGVGKTSLLREYAYLCQQRGVQPAYLDVRNARLSAVAVLDLYYTLEDVIAEGNRVIQRSTATGKGATGAEVHIVRIKDDKIVEHWASVDQLGMLQQLGLA